MIMKRRLVLLVTLGIAPMVVQGGVKDTVSAIVSAVSNHSYIAKACGTLMHVPYVITLDSKNPQAVRLAGILAALPTDCKLAFKFVEQTDDRFFKIMLWDVPKFVAYSGASAYDVLNVLNPEHMIVERKNKGEVLRKLKIDQAMSLSIEFVLRVLACVAAYKAADHRDNHGGADLNFVAALISEVADCAELSRLIKRYNSYDKVPWCDIGFNFEIDHVSCQPDDEASAVSSDDIAVDTK